jgi:hypothetical protein
MFYGRVEDRRVWSEQGDKQNPEGDLKSEKILVWIQNL